MSKLTLKNLTGCILVFTAAQAYSSGACCAIAKADDRIPFISVVGAYSWGHQMIAGQHYSLFQQSVMVKFGLPVYKGLSLNTQIGSPVRTVFGMDNKPGFGGLIIGGGTAYSFPQIARRLSFTVSVAAARSYSFFVSDIGRETLILTQALGFLAADLNVMKNFNVYGGINVSIDNEKIRNDTVTGPGESMFMLSPSAGIRFKINNRIATLFEAGFGHNNVLSLGIIFPINLSRKENITLSMD